MTLADSIVEPPAEEEEREEEHYNKIMSDRADYNHHEEEPWIDSYYIWSSNIKDPQKRERFRELFDKYLISEPIFCSNIFSDDQARQIAAWKSLVRRIKELELITTVKSTNLEKNYL